MPSTDRQVDAYIVKSADFAKPVLNHLRQLVHEVCPDVQEAIKWGHPTFMFKGILCMMAAFKQHCAFGFWKHKRIFGEDPDNLNKSEEAMGQLGRITSLADLPPDRVLGQYITKAAQLNELGVKVPRPPQRKSKRVAVPSDLAAAFKRNQKALETFENFSPSHKREYVEWLTEAKREETRLKRLDTALLWLAQGKPRHWKYANC